MSIQLCILRWLRGDILRKIALSHWDERKTPSNLQIVGYTYHAVLVQHTSGGFD
jgi:hypothetical protein